MCIVDYDSPQIVTAAFTIYIIAVIAPTDECCQYPIRTKFVCIRCESRFAYVAFEPGTMVWNRET